MEYKPNWDIASIPDELLYSEIGRRNAARRTSPLGGFREGAGRPPQLVDCPLGCGAKITKTAARRGHGCKTK